MCAALPARGRGPLGIENSAAVPVSVLLAGYARGLVEQSDRTVLHAARGTTGWPRAEWIQLRLAGVCMPWATMV